MSLFHSLTKRFVSCFIGVGVSLGLSLTPVMAKDVTIQVWAGGSNVNDSYRVDAISMAADILEKEAAILGEKLNITVESKYDFDGWGGFKQAVTLAAEANKAPHIVVTGHEDIAPWSQSGLIRPIENYVDFDTWPLNDLFENLVEIASYDGVIYGVPQDAESRPFFAWIPYLKAIGYSSADIRALPGKVERGNYTLYDVLDDAKKVQDAGLVKPGYGWYPRVSKGGDY
nr:extracellular solute-binding protein [Rhodospirillales bacterium]